MALYLFEAVYSNQSWATEIGITPSRVEEMGSQAEEKRNLAGDIGDVVTKYEGNMVGCYYAFGDRDMILLADFPKPEYAAAFSLGASATGLLKSMTTTPLLTAEQKDAAVEHAMAKHC